MGDFKSAKVFHLMNRTFRKHGDRKPSKTDILKKMHRAKNDEKNVCKVVSKNNSGGMQTWYKPKSEVNETNPDPRKMEERRDPQKTANLPPRLLNSNKTRRSASGLSGRIHTASINLKKGNTFLSRSRKIKTTTSKSKAKVPLVNVEKNFSSNSNKNLNAGSSKVTSIPVRKMPISKQNYSFINEMFEKNISKTRHSSRNDLQHQTRSTPNFVVQKSKQIGSRIPLMKGSNADKSQAKRRKSACHLKNVKAKKAESLKTIRKLPHETSRHAVPSDLNNQTSNRSSAKREKKPEEIIYCAICSILEQTDYLEPDECVQIMPAIEYDRASVRFLGDQKHLNDRYASKFENKMIISAGQLTDLIYLDNLKTKHEFKPLAEPQTQSKTAHQKRFCLTRLYSPVSSAQETSETSTHNSTLGDVGSKVPSTGRRMDSGDDDVSSHFTDQINVHLKNSPSTTDKELRDSYSNKINLKSNNQADFKLSHENATRKSPTRSFKSGTSETRLHEKSFKHLMRELELLRIKGLLSDDRDDGDDDNDAKNAANLSHKLQEKVKHSKPIKGFVNKNLNAKRGLGKDFGSESENRKKNFYKIVTQFVSDCLSPSSSHKNADDDAVSSNLKECKPFIFEPSKYSGDEEISEMSRVPLENRLRHLLSSNSSKEPPQCIEVPPYRSIRDFLQMPPKFFTKTDLPFNNNNNADSNSLDYNFSNDLSHNSNVNFAWSEYFNAMEHLERKKQRRKTSSEVLRIAWNSLNLGESFCGN